MKTVLAGIAAACLLPLGLNVSASAVVAEPRPQTATDRIVIADPNGDVRDTDGTRPGQVNATDVTKVRYAVVAGARQDYVRFTVEHRRSLGLTHPGHRFVTWFESGGRQYKTFVDRDWAKVLVKEDGRWVDGSDGRRYSSGYSEGRYYVRLPLSMFKSGELTDLRSTLFLRTSSARDTVAKTPDGVTLSVVDS